MTDYPHSARCVKCSGRGIIDWIEKAVVRPRFSGVDQEGASISSSSSNKSSKPGGASFKHFPIKLVTKMGNINKHKVTKHKSKRG